MIGYILEGSPNIAGFNLEVLILFISGNKYIY